MILQRGWRVWGLEKANLSACIDPFQLAPRRNILFLAIFMALSMSIKPAFYLSLGFVTGCASAFAETPSFNCNTATYPDERAICSNAELSQLDNVANAGYQYVHRVYGAQYSKSVDLPLLQARRACGSDATCIKEQQLAAIQKFQSLGAPVNVVQPQQKLTVPPASGQPTPSVGPSAQQADPYAAGMRQMQLEEFQRDWANFLETYRVLMFAVGCKVIQYEGVVLQRMGGELWPAFVARAPRAGQQLATFEKEMEKAHDAGLAYAKEKGCSYWQQHLDEAYRLRNAYKGY